MPKKSESSVILAIETALQGGSISIFRDEREVGFWTGNTLVSKAEEILEQIQFFLEDNKIDSNLINLINVADGPGSPTGKKIGIAIAKGLSRGWDCPLITRSVLECLTFKAESNVEGGMLTAVPINRDQIAWGLFAEQQNENRKKIVNAGDSDYQTFLNVCLLKECSQIIAHQSIFELLLKDRQFPFDKIIVNAGYNMAQYLNCTSYSL